MWSPWPQPRTWQELLRKHVDEWRPGRVWRRTETTGRCRNRDVLEETLLSVTQRHQDACELGGVDSPRSWTPRADFLTRASENIVWHLSPARMALGAVWRCMDG